MKKANYTALLLALTILLALPGCEGNGTGSDTSSAAPSESADVTSAPEPSDSDAPDASGSVETGDVSSDEPGEALDVDGAAVPAVLYESDLGYTMLYPREGITLSEWEGGQTFELTDAPGTYLAVSLLDVSNVDEAVAVVQFENAVDSDPSGYIFGAKSYAGVRLSDAAGGLTVDYIILREGDSVYLVERAVFTGGEGKTALLQSMLDSFTVT